MFVLLRLILAYYTHVPAFTLLYIASIFHTPEAVVGPAASLVITTPAAPLGTVPMSPAFSTNGQIFVWW